MLFDVRHQPVAHAVVQQSLLADRLPHGLLLVGPAGVGKEMFATRLAQLLLCPTPVKTSDGPRLAGLDEASLPPGLAPPPGTAWLDACGQCESCHLVQAGTHPDLHVIYRGLHKFSRESTVRNRQGLELYIDVVREFLIDVAAQKASRGHGKMFIIRDAHLLNEEAQNALLKTLEEPPPGTFIMLVTDQAHVLLETIRSRTQLVRFAPLPIAFVREQLVGRSVGARTVAADEAAYLAARTGGQLGVAIQMAENDVFGIHQELADRLANLAPVGAVDLADWLEQQINQLAKERSAREEITDSQAKKEVAGELLSTAALMISDAARLIAGHGSESTPPLFAEASRKLAHTANGSTGQAEERFIRLGKAIDALSRADVLIAVRFVNPRLALDEAALALAANLP